MLETDQRGTPNMIVALAALFALAGLTLAAFLLTRPVKTPPAREAPVENPTNSVTSTAVNTNQAKPPEHVPLNLAASFNAFIGENWKRENHDDDGIPADGRILVPSVLPRAYFQFVLPDAPNAIELGEGASATVVIPPERRGHYGRLAILHGSPKGPCLVHATLHYDSGADSAAVLNIQNWNQREEPKETFIHKALQAGKIQLYAQALKLDTARTLETVTFHADANACIFAMTAIVSPERPFDGGR